MFRGAMMVRFSKLMGAVFAMGSTTANLLTAPPESVVYGMRVTFAVAAGLILLALSIAFAGQSISRRTPH